MIKVIKTTLDAGIATIYFDVGDNIFQVQSRTTLVPYFDRWSRRPRFMARKTKYIVTKSGKDFQTFDSLNAAVQFIRG